jgi:hypothetical protein
MPNWISLLLLAAGAWLALSLVGGFAIGRLLALTDRDFRRRFV